MIEKFRKLRDEYGNAYATYLDDNTVIPWKPLSIGEYIEYDRALKRGIASLPQIEEEIFKKCVLDESFIRQLDFLKAGTVSTIVQCIWQYSGPVGLEALNSDLEAARQKFNDPSERAIHEMVQTITLAFQYKPEELYVMDYETLVFRLIQAEAKLMYGGLLKEPIQFQRLGEENNKRKKKPKFQNLNPEESKQKAEEIKKMWETAHGKKENLQSPKSILQVEKMPDMPHDKWWKKSPILESTVKHNIDFAMEKAEYDTFGVSGHEKTDLHLHRDKLVKDAQVIYKDVLEELAKRHKK